MTISRYTSLNDCCFACMISAFRILYQALDVGDFLVERANLVGSVTAGVRNFLKLAGPSRLKGYMTIH